MKQLLLILVFLLPLPAAAETLIKPTECKVVEKNSHNFMVCNYDNAKQQWLLTYKPGSYPIVVKSGRYAEMIDSLCGVRGLSVHETIHGFFRGRTREFSCAD
jgi:hypothetical protein